MRVIFVMLLTIAVAHADPEPCASGLRDSLKEKTRSTQDQVDEILAHYRFLAENARAILDGNQEAASNYFGYYDLPPEEHFRFINSVYELIGHILDETVTIASGPEVEYVAGVTLNDIQALDAYSRAISTYYQLILRNIKNPEFVIASGTNIPELHKELMGDYTYLRSKPGPLNTKKPKALGDAARAEELGIEPGAEKIKFYVDYTKEISERLTYLKMPVDRYLEARDKLKGGGLSEADRQLWKKRLAYWSDLHTTSWFLGWVEDDLEAYRQDPLLNPERREAEIRAFKNLLDHYRILYALFRSRQNAEQPQHDPSRIEKPRPWQEELVEEKAKLLNRVQNFIERQPDLGLAEGFPRPLTEQEKQQLTATLTDFVDLLQADKTREALTRHTHIKPIAGNISWFRNPAVVNGMREFIASTLRYKQDWVAFSDDLFFALTLDAEEERLESYTFIPSKRKGSGFELAFWRLPRNTSLEAWLLRDKLGPEGFWHLCYKDYVRVVLESSYNGRMKYWKKQEGITDDEPK